MMLIVFCALLAYAAGQGGPDAQQQAVLEQLRQVFNAIDENHDGAITLDEQFDYFDHVDDDGDGRLSYQEFLDNRNRGPGGGDDLSPQYLEATFRYYDTLGGTVEADNYLEKNDTRYFFTLLDADNDGRATLQEFDAAFLQIGEAIAQQLIHHGGPVGKRRR